MKNKKCIKNTNETISNKAITLIALIITIIVSINFDRCNFKYGNGRKRNIWKSK